jgi:hypothetical protein
MRGVTLTRPAQWSTRSRSRAFSVAVISVAEEHREDHVDNSGSLLCVEGKERAIERGSELSLLVRVEYGVREPRG